MEAVVAAFEDANPGVCVNNLFLPWTTAAEPADRIRAGNPPDVTMFGRQDLPFFAVTEQIIPLDDSHAAEGSAGTFSFQLNT